VCTSIVVACELRYGAAKKGSSAFATRVNHPLSAIEVLPMGESIDAMYVEIRTALEKAGTPIGANDYLIAAHALAADLETWWRARLAMRSKALVRRRAEPCVTTVPPGCARIRTTGRVPGCTVRACI
jgi:predicted nucleic acid-binding protein